MDNGWGLTDWSLTDWSLVDEIPVLGCSVMELDAAAASMALSAAAASMEIATCQ